MRMEMNHLKIEIDKCFGRGTWDLNYKLRSANLKIESVQRTIFGQNECADTAHLEMKASEVEKKLHQLQAYLSSKKSQNMKQTI